MDGNQIDPREKQRAAAEARLKRVPCTTDINGNIYAFTRTTPGDGGVSSVLGVPVRQSWSLQSSLTPQQKLEMNERLIREVLRDYPAVTRKEAEEMLSAFGGLW